MITTYLKSTIRLDNDDSKCQLKFTVIDDKVCVCFDGDEVLQTMTREDAIKLATELLEVCKR
jgi:hypothetical protein